MTPLCVQTTAPLGYVAGHPVHLDALLMSIAAKRSGRPQPQTADELAEVAIPIARSDCGRYYLASAAIGESAAHETRYTHHRFPMREAVHLAGPKLKRIDDGAGKHKSYRIPSERDHARGGLLTWWCVGERDAIRDLLEDVTHIGRKRGVGEGMLTLRGERWTVDPCDTWPGFPVLGPAGEALRNLPLDTPGLASFRRAEAPLAPPYWLPSAGLVAVPVRR